MKVSVLFDFLPAECAFSHKNLQIVFFSPWGKLQYNKLTVKKP